MKNIFKIFLLITLTFSIKSKAQLDTLNYLKQFEVNKANYIGQPFSKLLDDMKVLIPKRLYTQNNGCNYWTQFWFIDDERPFDSVYKMDIIWENSSLFKGEEIKDGFHSLDNIEKVYKKYIVKKLDIQEGGLDLSVSHYFSNKLNPSSFIDSYLKENKPNIINNSFLYFLCFLRTASMKIVKVKNIYINKKKDVLQTIFTVYNPNNRKKTKIIVTWETPIPDYQIKDYQNKNGKRFNNDNRNLYVDKIIKDIMLYKKISIRKNL